jgi:hypothetical protein
MQDVSAEHGQRFLQQPARGCNPQTRQLLTALHLLPVGSEDGTLGCPGNPSLVAPGSTMSEDPGADIASPRKVSPGRVEPGPLTTKSQYGSLKDPGGCSIATSLILRPRLHLTCTDAHGALQRLSSDHLQLSEPILEGTAPLSVCAGPCWANVTPQNSEFWNLTRIH